MRAECRQRPQHEQHSSTSASTAPAPAPHAPRLTHFRRRNHALAPDAPASPIPPALPADEPQLARPVSRLDRLFLRHRRLQHWRYVVWCGAGCRVDGGCVCARGTVQRVRARPSSSPHSSNPPALGLCRRRTPLRRPDQPRVQHGLHLLHPRWVTKVTLPVAVCLILLLAMIGILGKARAL